MLTYTREVEIVGRPDGRFGALATNRDRAGLQVIESDGSSPSGIVRPTTRETIHQVLWDGWTWMMPVTTYGTSGTCSSRAQVARGDALTSLFAVGASTTGSAETSSIAARGDEAVIVLTMPPPPGTTDPASLRILRAGIPASATGALTLRAPATPLGDVTTAVAGMPVATVFTGDEQIVAVWSDRRWGQTEIYSMVVDVPDCD
ncbi:hypothetical protein [Sandaracinus amylolyticus]|uniref:hypothetical protein n=1 Tax=Sandaracinus amylolyticus TaxID=927083 RepID=UPI001F2B36F4|nr:hypothetical protein [Sandaracinus amylolyticus]UJR84027.1 Hypothetical protein I5071_60980 [Sandaracinus amylolyticus]